MNEMRGSVLAEIVAAIQRVRPGGKPIVVTRDVPDMDSACELTTSIAKGTQSSLKALPKEAGYEFECMIRTPSRKGVRVAVAIQRR